MISEYSCNYLLRTGGIYGWTCRRPKGCYKYWKAKARLSCKVCGKSTSSELGLCRKHTSGYYMTQYINQVWDKARNNARMIEMLKEARMLEDAKLLEDTRRLEEGY